MHVVRVVEHLERVLTRTNRRTLDAYFCCRGHRRNFLHLSPPLRAPWEQDESQWKRISQEVKLMEKLNHPRVVRLFESVSHGRMRHEKCSDFIVVKYFIHTLNKTWHLQTARLRRPTNSDRPLIAHDLFFRARLNLERCRTVHCNKCPSYLQPVG